MKRLVISMLLLPALATAHGGVTKVINNSMVFLNQDPLSPRVGEEVIFSFALTNLNYEPISNQPVKLSLIDTFFNDATKDTTIFEQNFTTDANGNFEFKYKFSKENYFDIDLAFKDPTSGAENQTGFLVQTRGQSNKQSLLNYGLILVLGILVGITPLRFRPKS